MIPQLLKIIRESIKAVPAMKYALAIAGLLAVVALVGALKVSPQTAVLGTVVTLVLMVAMVVFARLSTTAPRHFFLPVQVMLWTFLMVTVATAFLLFTSAFFQWPRGLHELMSPRSPPAVAAATPSAPANRPAPKAEQPELNKLITIAREHLSSRDYATAWSTIGQAVEQDPASTEARDAKVQIALAWIRDMSVRKPETYTNALRPLTDFLRMNLDRTKGNVPADIYAHLGWASFLRQTHDHLSELKVDDDFTSAIARDAANPFANVMWAYVLAKRRRPLFELKPHFVLALSTGRERAFVQDLRVVTLLNTTDADAISELLRVADEMRRKGDALDLVQRKRILSEVYSGFGRRDETKLLALLSPADHLLTFEWLVTDLDLENNPEYAYFHARLTEATGDDVKAAEGYRKLVALDISHLERAKAGLARCEQRIANRKR
jgi:hypothetical protein